MAIYQGYLRKMRVHYESAEKPVEYWLTMAEDDECEQQALLLNSLLEQRIRIRYKEQIRCIACARVSKKSFNQGYCYPCFSRLAACDKCIMSPQKCHYEQGTCREPQWGESHCMQSHYVYLANSSGLKVGITRGDQLPTRWIDQGAIQALPIFKVSQRYYSGLIEVIYKQQISDRTQWQRMLKGQVEPIDLLKHQQALYQQFYEPIEQLLAERGLAEDAIVHLDNEAMVEIQYPVISYPTKVKSFNLDKQALVEGVLMGIKGQYLILDTGVINIRKFSAYQVEIEL